MRGSLGQFPDPAEADFLGHGPKGVSNVHGTHRGFASEFYSGEKLRDVFRRLREGKFAAAGEAAPVISAIPLVGPVVALCVSLSGMLGVRPVSSASLMTSAMSRFILWSLMWGLRGPKEGRYLASFCKRVIIFSRAEVPYGNLMP